MHRKIISFILLWILVCMPLWADGTDPTSSAKAVWCWYDNQAPFLTTLKDVTEQRLDCSMLSEGIHELHIQIENTDGTWSPVETSWFILKNTDAKQAEIIRYWFDHSLARHETPSNDGTVLLDCSMLTVGPHFLHYQIKCNDGSYSPVYSSLFYMDIVGSKAEEIQYWFDNNSERKVASATNGVILQNCESLSDGIHILNYQIKNTDGTYSPVQTALFFNAMTTSEAMVISYWFNEDGHRMQIDLTDDNPVLDCSDLGMGTHTLFFQIESVDGTYSPVYSATFEKTTASDIDDVHDNGNTNNTIIYNINGVRMSSPHLPNGIYIINGKKVLIKN